MNPGANIDLGGWAARLAAPFWRWLKGELTLLLPAPLRRLGAARRAETLIVHCDGRSFFVPRRRKDAPGAAAVVPLDELVQAEQIVGPEQRGKRLAFVLRLPREQGLCRTVSLPRAAAENLRRILLLEMDRNTPWPGDQVYFDAEIVGRSDDERMIAVRLAVLPRAAADPLLQALREVGLSPVALDLAGDDPDAPARLNLLGSTPRTVPSGSRRLIWGGLSAATAAGLVLAFGLALYNRSETLSDLQQRLDTGRAEAEIAARLGTQLAGVRKEASYLQERKRNTAPIISVLEILSERLPDDCWLNEIRINQGEVQILGYAKDASALVPTLEGTGYFARAAHRSPIVANAAAGVDHFHVAAAILPPADAAR